MGVRALPRETTALMYRWTEGESVMDSRREWHKIRRRLAREMLWSRYKEAAYLITVWLCALAICLLFWFAVVSALGLTGYVR